MTTPAKTFQSMIHLTTVSAVVDSVVDGDTVHATLTSAIPAPFNIDLSAHRKIRLAGINCPELSTPQGMTARDFTRQWLLDHPGPYTASIHGSGADKYGDRVDARLIAADGKCLNDDLLTAGQAVVMKG